MGEYKSHTNVPDSEEVEFIYVKFPDNRVFKIPAEVIADSFAQYYSDKDEDRSYEDEYNFAMEDPYQLHDWLMNNMNWEDVEDEAELVRHEKSDLHEEFLDAEVSYYTG